MSVGPELEKEHPLPDTQIAQEAVSTLRQLKAQRHAGDKRPFFLAVGFHKPHLPFVVAQRYFQHYPPAVVELPDNPLPPKGMPQVAWSSYGELLAYSDQAALNNTGMPGDTLPHEDELELRRAYYAAISQTDDMIGIVLDALEETGEADNTVISLFGDHGWQLGEHGEWAKHTNFELATRAPLLVSVPGLTDDGGRSDHYTEHVDLFPTLTEVATGIRLPHCPAGDDSFKVKECTEGSSLVPLMKEPSSPVKAAAFSQYPRGYIKPSAFASQFPVTSHVYPSRSKTSPCILRDKKCTMGYTVVTSISGHEYRYTEWADFNTPRHKLRVNWARIVGVELYNHTADPGENFNINSTCSGDPKIQELSAQLSIILRAGPDAARVQPPASELVV